jgi:hypothetical protein
LTGIHFKARRLFRANIFAGIYAAFALLFKKMFVYQNKNFDISKLLLSRGGKY